MWLPLQLFGIQPFKSALEEKILLCRYFYDAIQRLGFEVGPYPDLSVCTYRYLPLDGSDADGFNRQLVEYVQRDGRIFVSSTNIGGVFWIRLAVLCFRTHLREIDLLLEIFENGVKTLEKH
jgi:aromatic-L-amino-acid/L-tryptophan decarboxylase